MANTVERESLTTKSRHVSLTYEQDDGTQVLAGSSRSMPTLDIAHLRLHEGRAFYAYKFHSSTNLLADGASINIAIACAEGCELHMLVDFECAGSSEFYWYEGATVSEGTPFTPINRKRKSTNTSDAVTLINPTISNAGTLLVARSIPGGTGPFAGGGESYSFEYVLKDLTTYLFTLKNTSGAARAAHMLLEWYE
jgi:hypothetical protein